MQRPNLSGERLKLQDCCRPMHVNADEHHLLLFLVDEPFRELGGRGRLTGALQAREHDDYRWLRTKIERDRFGAEDLHKLTVDDLDELLPRSKALAHLFAERARSHALDKRLYDGQRDIGFEQGEPHLPQSVLDIGFGQPALAA